MKVRELLRRLAQDGWYVERVRGSHRHFRHPTKSGAILIAFHSRNQDVHRDIVIHILRKAGLL
ncbi:MAG: type II toxin-antitoxin system HicA family toxin [Candidatus Eremiobacteraeota bacterium]|nr:type II toxin-antitoxin system HicA family toxin [Candidatus Eremiobacteraeota bacterium]